MASTLQRLVSGVVGQVVMLVLLEQVAGVHLVAVLHQTLREETQRMLRTDTRGKQGHRWRAELHYLLSDQQGGALQGHRHHLVRVPGDRVCPEGDTKHG